MKKLSKYIAFAFLGMAMASCGDDYNDWANPQTNPQEDAITIPGLTATAADAIDLANVSEDSVSTFTLSTAALPEGFKLADARVEVTPQGVEGATKTTFNAGIEGRAAAADLSDLVVNTYGKRPTARTFDAHVYLDAVKDGQAVLIDAGKINVVVTPKAPYIASNYYLVGDMYGEGKWALADCVKFNHSDADVYEDPVFTLMVTTTKDNQYWKIIPQGNIDAGNPWAIQNDPKGVVGVTKNGDDAMSGTLVTSVTKDDGTTDAPNAAMIAKAGIYQITINMMDYTYTIKQISPEYYLVGKLQGWSDKPENKTCLMYAESAMVQSYTTQWNDDANLKIWLGSDWGDWNNAYGSATMADANTPTGNLKVDNKAGAIVCPEPGAYYTFTADFSTMTYSWTKLENQNPTAYEKVGLIGVGGDWDNDVDMTEVTPHNWFIEKNIPEGSFKIRANHKWDDAANWGFAEGQEFSSTGKLITSGGSKDIKIAAGKYRIFFNDITLEYAIIAVAE
jgi:hypothetical protein